MCPLELPVTSAERRSQGHSDSRVYAGLFYVTVKPCQVNPRSRQGKAKPGQAGLAHNLLKDR